MAHKKPNLPMKFAFIASVRSYGVRSGKGSGIKSDFAAIAVEMLARPEVQNPINPNVEHALVVWEFTLAFRNRFPVFALCSPVGFQCNRLKST